MTHIRVVEAYSLKSKYNLCPGEVVLKVLFACSKLQVQPLFLFHHILIPLHCWWLCQGQLRWCEMSLLLDKVKKKWKSCFVQLSHSYQPAACMLKGQNIVWKYKISKKNPRVNSVNCVSSLIVAVFYFTQFGFLYFMHNNSCKSLMYSRIRNISEWLQALYRISKILEIMAMIPTLNVSHYLLLKLKKILLYLNVSFVWEIRYFRETVQWLGEKWNYFGLGQVNIDLWNVHKVLQFQVALYCVFWHLFQKRKLAYRFLGLPSNL